MNLAMDPERVGEKAKEMFGAKGLFCAETVLALVAEEAGISSPLIPRIATGFCGGVARTRGMCGAVAGGVMAIGLLYGRDKAGQPYDAVYAKVQQFLSAFEKEYKTINCFELTGCDLGTEQGQQAFVEKEVMEQCRRFTARAASLVAELVGDE